MAGVRTYWIPRIVNKRKAGARTHERRINHERAQSASAARAVDVSPGLPHQKDRRHPYAHAHSHPPHRYPLCARLSHYRRRACCRCWMRLLPAMTPPLHQGTAGQAQPLQPPPPPLSQPSAACTLSCGRFPPSSSAPADAPAGRGGLTRVPAHRSQTASHAAFQSSKPSVTRAPGSSTSPSCSRCSASASPPACGCGRRKVARTGSSPPGSSPAAAPPRRARHGP